MSEDTLGKAREAAVERGKIWLEKFKTSPLEEQIEYLAQELFYAIEHNPYGSPNGRQHWHEIPDVDENYVSGTDKLRYKYAAETAVKIVGYMGLEKSHQQPQ